MQSVLAVDCVVPVLVESSVQWQACMAACSHEATYTSRLQGSNVEASSSSLLPLNTWCVQPCIII